MPVKVGTIVRMFEVLEGRLCKVPHFSGQNLAHEATSFVRYDVATVANNRHVGINDAFYSPYRI